VDERIFVCRKCKNARCLVGVLQTRRKVPLRLLKCQKICHGPVIGLEIGGRMEWFERVDDLKSLAALVRLAKKPRAPVKIPKPLRKHRVKRYSGRAPRA
jgi:hypothetical protein